LERQPAEPDIMERGPRDPREKLLDTKTLLKSILQGLVIFAASFGAYYAALVKNPDGAAAARAMGLAVIMFANLFLVIVNSSDTDSIFVSIRLLAKDKVMRAVVVVIIAGLLIILYTPLNDFLKLAPLSVLQLSVVFGLGAASVLWYEIVKLFERIKRRRV